MKRMWTGMMLAALALFALVGRTGAQTPGPLGWDFCQDGFCGGIGGPIPGATPGATPGPAPEVTPGPPSRPVPTPMPDPCPTQRIVASGPWRDESRGVCFVIVQVLDLCTGNPQGDPFTREVECPRAAPSNPCVDENGNPLFSIGPDGIWCGRAGAQWRVEARVRFPPYVIDVRPYPATLVGWPTAIRLAALHTASGEGTLSYVPLGGGKSVDEPKPGDWKDVKLRLELVPAVNGCQIFIPQARGPMTRLERPENPLPLWGIQWLGQQGAYIYWEVPSHPDAGGTVLDPGLNRQVGLPEDFPAFSGWARAPYYLKWTFEWEEYKEEINKYCDDRSPPGNECDSNGDGVKDRKWRWETRRWWERKSEGGIVPPGAVRGLPPQYVAGPDTFWNYNIVIRRMNADGFQVRIWGGTNFGSNFRIWVREGQGQIGWPGR